MRKCCRPASLLLLLTLNACSSSAPPPKTTFVHPLEQNAVNAMHRSMTTDAIAALDAALGRYQALDDIAGQWRIHLLKAHLALSTDDSAMARREADVLEDLARLLDAEMVGYQTHLVMGRVNGDRAEYDAALRYARTPLQQAVIKTYLGDTTSAFQLIDPDGLDHPSDRAFVYYKRATETRSSDLFSKALSYYRLAEDARGVADSLVSLARIAASANRTTQARTYAARAINVLAASGDKKRADAIRNWLDSL